MKMKMNWTSTEYPSVMTNSVLYGAWNATNDVTVACIEKLLKPGCLIRETTCMSLEKQPEGGILSDKHHILRGSLEILMVNVILLNVVYLAVFFILKPFKQSKFVCSILAGIILRNIMIGVISNIEKDNNIEKAIKVFTLPVEGHILLNTLGFLGMTLFIFLTAVKMDITMIRRTAKKATIVGLLSLLLPFACVAVLLNAEGDKFTIRNKHTFFRYLFASGLTVTRFINTAYAFDEMNLLTSKLGQLVMSSTMVDELFTWLSLITGTAFGQVKTEQYKVKNNFTLTGPLLGLCGLLYIVVLVVFTVLIIRPILVSIVKKTPQGKPVKRIFIVGILVLAMVMTFLTELIGAPHMGVLILGFAVPDGPPLGLALVRSAELFVMNYLMPLFYIIIGYNVKLSKILSFHHSENHNEVFVVITSIVLASVTKFIGGVLGALSCKLSGKHAIIVGLMVNIKGPMDLFLFYRWNKNTKKKVTDDSYAILVFSHVILTAIVTALIKRLYNSNHENMISSSGGTVKSSMRDTQTNPSIGEMRILCCVHHIQDVPIFLSLLKASNPTFNSPTSAYVAQLNNLDGRAVPVIFQDDCKIRRVHSNRLDRIAFEFEKYAADANRLVITKMYTMIAPYKTMHQNIIGLAQEENIALIVSPFHKNYTALDTTEVGGVRIFNKNLLNFSHCTVGVLVDRGMSQFTTSGDHDLSCNIAVLFIGGADDREAVTFATRMLGNPSVNMTLVRLQITNYYSSIGNDPEVKSEMKLDEAVIRGFRVKGEKKHDIVYREMKVETIEEALDGIRTLGSAQNLILVGRQRHVDNSIFDDAMLEWSENRELGAVGDFVSSADFQDGKASVLVMQRFNIKNEGWSGSHHSLQPSESNNIFVV